MKRSQISCPLLGPSALIIVGGAMVGYGTRKLINHFLDRKEIDYRNNKIIFTMSSAEMHEDELIDDITLSSKDNFKCLRGKLHVEGIRKILVDDKFFSGTLKNTLTQSKLKQIKSIGKIPLLRNLNFYAFDWNLKDIYE